MKTVRLLLLFALLWLCLLGCTEKNSDPAPALSPSPAAAESTPVYLPIVTASPAPTADPLLGCWEEAEGRFSLTLAADGSYTVTAAGKSAQGAYVREKDTLLFIRNGEEYSCGYSLAENRLLLELPEGAALILEKK